MGRRPALVLAASVVAALLTTVTGARATESQEADLVSRINAERASRGLGAVAVRADLTEAARAWSEQMAAEGGIRHDPDLPEEVSGWTALGDNVGRGPDVASVHDAFMRSGEHRSIILDERFNQVGVGVARAGDLVYVTEVFVRRGATVVRRTTTNRRATARSAASAGALPAVSFFRPTGLVWEIELGARSLTVSMLEQLIGLDAP